MVVALIALFIALDGPATAARLIDGQSIARNSITTHQIKNGSLGTQDLSKTAVKALKATPAGSVGATQLAAKAVTGAKLADGAVGNGQLAPKSVDAGKLADSAVGASQLAPGAVNASKLADGSVGGAAIADGTLQTTDVGDFFGSVSVDFAPFGLNDCQKAEVSSPTPTGDGDARIGDDVIIVTPQAGFSDLIWVTGNPGANNTLRIIACRVGKDPANPAGDDTIDPPPTRFYYLGIDAP
jgi:hypothetical protein